MIGAMEVFQDCPGEGGCCGHVDGTRETVMGVQVCEGTVVRDGDSGV
jgi:hypothetical protein